MSTGAAFEALYYVMVYLSTPPWLFASSTLLVADKDDLKFIDLLILFSTVSYFRFIVV